MVNRIIKRGDMMARGYRIWEKNWRTRNYRTPKKWESDRKHEYMIKHIILKNDNDISKHKE